MSVFVLSPEVIVAVTVVVPAFLAVRIPFAVSATPGFEEVYVTSFVMLGDAETESLAVLPVFPPA